MRRKEVLNIFKNTFSHFMLNNGYTFYKNCFIKYHNGVFNRVSIFTQKAVDTISFDIIHYCKPIYEDFISIEDENESDDFSLAWIAFADNIIDDVEWEYEYGNNEDMVSKIQIAFNVYKKYYEQFDCESIDDYNTHLQEYNRKLHNTSERDPYEFISELFSGEVSLDSIPKNKQKKLQELLTRARTESYYIIQRFNEISQDLPSANSESELKMIAERVSAFNDDIQYIQALCYDDKEYLRKIQDGEDAERQRIIENNKRLLFEAGLFGG